MGEFCTQPSHSGQRQNLKDKWPLHHLSPSQNLRLLLLTLAEIRDKKRFSQIKKKQQTLYNEALFDFMSKLTCFSAPGGHQVRKAV